MKKLKGRFEKGPEKGNLFTIRLTLILLLFLALGVCWGGDSKFPKCAVKNENQCLTRFVDPRDGNEYVVLITPSEKGYKDTLMMENMRYNTVHSQCLYDSISCRGYGRVYPTEDLELVCPDGWFPTGFDDLYKKSAWKKRNVSVAFLTDSAFRRPVKNEIWIMESEVKLLHFDGTIDTLTNGNVGWSHYFEMGVCLIFNGSVKTDFSTCTGDFWGVGKASVRCKKGKPFYMENDYCEKNECRRNLYRPMFPNCCGLL